MSIDEILQNIQQYDCRLVEVTGGEPLLQKECIPLIDRLLSKGFKVMLETGGSLPIKDVPDKVIKIIDFKCPYSKMDKKNLWSILDDMTDQDEIKFVIGNREDYDWAKERIKEYSLTDKWTVLFTCVFDHLKYETLAEWILEDGLDVRFQVQMHKHIWDPEAKGV